MWLRVLTPIVTLSVLGASIVVLATENPAHICGDPRLSTVDQTACRSQMGTAKDDVQRAATARTFADRANATRLEGGSSIAAEQKKPASTLIQNGPATASEPGSSEPRDSYPPAVAQPPAYPGNTPQPSTGRPPA